MIEKSEIVLPGQLRRWPVPDSDCTPEFMFILGDTGAKFSSNRKIFLVLASNKSQPYALVSHSEGFLLRYTTLICDALHK